MKMDEKKKISKGSRTTAIIVFVVLALSLVGYTIYVFEAFKNNWIPFGKWEPTKDQLPPDAIIPRKRSSSIDTDITPDELEDRMVEILSQNKTWYDSSKTCSASNSNCAVKLPGGQTILEPSD